MLSLRSYLAILLLSGDLLSAQSQAPASTQDQAPTFRTRSDLVTVPVVVTRDGKPVRGLKMEDFQLLHNGKPEKIAVFEEVGDRRKWEASSGPHPGEVQNYISAESQDVVILVLDLMLLEDWFYSDNNIRSSLADMARQFAAERTPVSVLVLTGAGMTQVHSFTSSPGDLTKSVDAFVTRRRDVQNKDVALTTREQADLRSLDPPSAYFEQVRLQDTRLQLDAVTQIAQAYRGIPGRKKLIWMSTSFFGTSAAETSDLVAGVGKGLNSFPRSEVVSGIFKNAEMRESAWQKLSDANIAVYPLNSRGVTNPAWDERFSAERNGGDNFQATYGGGAGARSSSVARAQTLMGVAQKTGGHVCTDLPVRCVRAVQADANEYYVLGFYLSKDARPGWHSVKVDAKQPGLSLRARDGFSVEPKRIAGRPAPAPASVQKVSAAINTGGTPKAEPAYVRDEVLTALAAPVDYTGIPLKLRWNVSGAGADPRKVELLLSSPAGGITVDPQDPTMNIDLLAFVRESGNVAGNSFPESLVKKLAPQEQRRLASAGFAFRKVLTLPAGRYGLRILLRDNTTHKIGTVSAYLVVR